MASFLSWLRLGRWKTQASNPRLLQGLEVAEVKLVCLRNRNHKRFAIIVHVPHLFLYDEDGRFREDLDVTDGNCIVHEQGNTWK
jgi:hypothetical protein